MARQIKRTIRKDTRRQGVPSLDPITLEVLWSRLVTIAEEQAKALIRASFTSILSEAEDLACGIYDSRGDIMAQAVTGTQGVLVGMTRGIKKMLEEYPLERLEPGDVLIGNDPWVFSGHKFDIAIASPIFFLGRPVGMVASISHAYDVGGVNDAATSNDVFEEGLEIPILKLYRRGKRNEDLFKILRSNVRIPEQILGDRLAQVACNQVAIDKVVEFMKEYRLKELDSLSQVILNKTEERVRQAIQEIPDGTSKHEVWLDGIDEPLKVAARVTIKGKELTIDFDGSSPQTRRGGINSVYNFTYAYATHAIKCALVPTVPNNEGLFRSINVVAPEGSIVSASFPAPVMQRCRMCPFISAAVFGALSKMIPDRVIADSAMGHTWQVSGKDEKGETFVYWLIGYGGMGARPNKDGLNATDFPANIGNVPVEIMENVTPLVVMRKELICDSGGPGKHRGGCDQITTLRVRSQDPVTLHCFFEHTKFPTMGFHGGMEGACARLLINGHVHPKPKEEYILKPGDEVAYSQGGGAGYFRPTERDPEKVLWDVINGYVSPEKALEVYKVAVDLANRKVDWKRTQELRQQ